MTSVYQYNDFVFVLVYTGKEMKTPAIIDLPMGLFVISMDNLI